MDSDENFLMFTLTACAAACLLLTTESKQGACRRKRSCWVKDWVQKRGERSSYQFLSKELHLEDEATYKNFIRMSESSFQKVLSYVSRDLKKQDTKMRAAIPVEEKLAVALRFLATGESYKSLKYQTRISDTFISNEVPKICDAIYNNMAKEFLKFPVNKEEWKKIAEGFHLRWQFPVCLGALDGKHIAFRAPRKDGALYFNYKGFNSIVLLALSDASYKFTFIDVGCNGRISDGGVLARSDLMHILRNGTHFFPDDVIIGDNRRLPYVIIGDDAFPLQQHLMKPYPYTSSEKYKQVYNVRLSHARQTVEHVFGMLSNRFRVLQTTINLAPEKVKSIVKACCVLHNFLTQSSDWYIY